MGQVQLGLIVPDTTTIPGLPGRLYMEQIQRLLNTVKGHYASAWSIDHLHGDMLEGWTAVAFLAALHPGLEWGHTVLCQSFRSPALLAKMGATLQLMSGGRFILGIGAGGQEQEYVAYGYPFPRAGRRVAELDEALHIIGALWTHERATFEGSYHRIVDARCAPKPEPRPTIMVGAFGPQMLRLTARHADWWNVSSTDITAYRRLVDAFERACDEVGRDPASLRRTWGGGCVCAPSAAEVARLAAARQQSGAQSGYQIGEDFVGTPAQLIEQMQPFVELGVDYFMLDCGGFPQLTTVELLIGEVLPALRR